VGLLAGRVSQHTDPSLALVHLVDLLSIEPRLGEPAEYYQKDIRYLLHLHLGHLADAFIQSDLQRVQLLKERQQYLFM